MYCLSVLVCQENLNSYLKLEKTLLQSGIYTQVQYTTTVAACLANLRSSPFDLLLLDSCPNLLTSEEFNQIKSQNILMVLVGQEGQKIIPSLDSLGILYTITPNALPKELALLTQRIIRTHTNRVNIHQAIYLKTGRSLTRFVYNDIDYIQADGPACILYSKDGMFSIQHTMTEVQNILPISLFRRIHKSFIISLFKIEVIQYGQVQVGKKTIPVGNAYKKNIQHFYDILQKS